MSTIIDNNRYLFIAGKSRHIRGAHRSSIQMSAVPIAPIAFADRFVRPERVLIKNVDWLAIENQGARGKCVSQTFTSAARYVWRALFGETLLFSDDAFYAMLLEWAGNPLTEDPGSSAIAAIAVGESQGFPLWDDYPDDPRSLRSPDAATRARAQGFRLGLTYRCPNAAIIEGAIAQNRPVAIAFECFASIGSSEVARTGVIPFSPDERVVGAHEVLIVGADRRRRLFYFLNSWGDNWGLDVVDTFGLGRYSRGFGALPYEFLEQGFAFDPVSIRTMVKS